MPVAVRPVTPQEWPAFEALFTSRGCPGFCWCVPYRFPDAHTMDRGEKRAAMRERIAQGVPVGVLAFNGGEPVGWCSIAPRETYAKLERSRVMPKVDDGAWTVLCLFVRRDHRGQGASKRLLEGALKHAKAGGAAVVEAYPWDTAGITATNHGHSSLFAQAGFEREGTTRRWVHRLGSRRRAQAA